MVDYDAARTAMVDCQVRPSDVTRYPIIEAMLTIPREEFVPSSHSAVAYADLEIPLPGGRAMIEPRNLAKLVDAAAVTGGDLVLVVGANTGYGAAVIGWMAEAVIALEEDEALASAASRHLVAIEALNVVVEQGPLAAGAPDHGPYDLVFIEGAVELVPDALLAQVKQGGRIAAFVVRDGRSQAMIGVKSEGGVGWRRAFDATAPVLPGFAAEKTFEF